MSGEKNQPISGTTRVYGEDSTSRSEQPRMCGERGKLVDLVKTQSLCTQGTTPRLRGTQLDLIKNTFTMYACRHQGGQ